LACVSVETCDTCKDGFFLTFNKTCNKSPLCLAGQYPSAGKCVNCLDANCLSCAAANGACNTCKAGFYLAAANKACVACSAGQRTCSEQASGLVTNALTCLDGYVKVGAACSACAGTGCRACDNTTATGCRACWSS